MVTVLGRKPIMALYSGTDCLYSHGCRIVLFEKEIECQVIYTEPGDSCQELAELNPYNETPTLVDRDLLLHNASVINDYRDERYPHPPLMPVDPVSRARLRLVHHRVLRDWFPLAEEIENSTGRKAEKAKQQLKESIVAANDLFQQADYLISDELSLVDCTLGPLFWRLPVYGIDLGKGGSSVQAYVQRVFSRPSFKTSLTRAEREMVLDLV